MARDVMSPIDLRSPAERQGFTRNQQTIQAIAGIMQTIGEAEQARRDSQTLTRITRALASGKSMPEAIMATINQPTEFSGGVQGILQKAGGMFQPSPGLMGKNLQQAMIGQAIQTDPLDTERKRAQIESAKALTTQRQEATKQALPDRMLRQADRWLRIVDDVMSEYWYTPEGPYRDKLLKDAQSAREKAIKLIEKYGSTSEAGKASLQQLESLDKEIEKAGGKVSKPKNGKISSKPNKAQFMTTYKNLKTPEEKQRFLNRYWRPEFGRHLE